MDFSIAPFIAILSAEIGLTAAVIFVVAEFRSYLRLIAISCAVSLILNELLFGIGVFFSDLPIGMDLIRIGSVGAYGLVGCVVGVLFIIFGRYVFIKLIALFSN